MGSHSTAHDRRVLTVRVALLAAVVQNARWSIRVSVGLPQLRACYDRQVLAGQCAADVPCLIRRVTGCLRREASAQRFAASLRSDGADHGAAFIEKVRNCLERNVEFTQFATNLQPSASETEAMIKSAKALVEKAVQDCGDWEACDMELTGSCSRAVDVSQSDLDFVMDIGGSCNAVDNEVKALVQHLERDDRVSEVAIRTKSIEFSLRVNGLQSKSVSVVIKDSWFDENALSMPLLQGRDDRPCSNNTEFHKSMLDFYSQYPGGRNVVRVLKGLARAQHIDTFYGYIIEAMVQRAGRIPGNWKKRAEDPSGRHLMNCMLRDFYVYPKHDTRESLLSYYLKSATQRCTEGNKKPLREAEEVCERLQKLASEILMNKPPSSVAPEPRIGNEHAFPSPEMLRSTVLAAKRPLKAREVYLLAIGKDPSTAQIGGLGKRIKRELYKMKNAGLLLESSGLWTAP